MSNLGDLDRQPEIEQAAGVVAVVSWVLIPTLIIVGIWSGPGTVASVCGILLILNGLVLFLVQWAAKS